MNSVMITATIKTLVVLAIGTSSDQHIEYVGYLQCNLQTGGSIQFYFPFHFPFDLLIIERGVQSGRKDRKKEEKKNLFLF